MLNKKMINQTIDAIKNSHETGFFLLEQDALQYEKDGEQVVLTGVSLKQNITEHNTLPVLFWLSKQNSENQLEPTGEVLEFEIPISAIVKFLNGKYKEKVKYPLYVTATLLYDINKRMTLNDELIKSQILLQEIRKVYFTPDINIF